MDDLIRPDHSYLAPTDECFFIGEYKPRQGFKAGWGNDLVSNLKKSPLKKALPEYRYKVAAIRQAAGAWRGALPADWIARTTFVPVPPSKCEEHPEYDDRVEQMARLFAADVRLLVRQDGDREAAHLSDDRPKPADHLARYQIDERFVAPLPTQIAVIDDMLTTGASFVAMRTILAGRFPGVPVYGLFLTRRVPEAFDFNIIFDGL